MMGTDMFLTLQNWREPERITALAGICAFARTQADCGELLTIQAEHLRKTFGAKVCVLQLPQVVDMSSTRLRELLARGGVGSICPRRCTGTSCATGSTGRGGI